MPTPIFVNDVDGLNPTSVINDMVAMFESDTNRTLYPAQVEQLLINLYAYREVLVRNAIQQCGLQNLLAFAQYPMINYLGEYLNCQQLPAQPATAPLQITLVAAQIGPTTISAGYQVGTTDGAFTFETTEDLVIPAGATVGTIPGTATAAGTGGNGYIPNTVTVPITVNALIASVTNTATSANGDEEESIDHYRVRIQAAPNQLTTAGPAGSYRSLALGVSSTIVDAFVPQVPATPGLVDVWILTGPVSQPAASPNNAGIASGALISAVTSTLSAQTVRPLCDSVVVHAVTEVDYAIQAIITLYANVNFATLNTALTSAAQQMALKLAANIGQDIVTKQWEIALGLAGVYNVDVTITANIAGVPLVPTADGIFALVTGQWANCTSAVLTVVFGAKTQPTS